MQHSLVVEFDLASRQVKELDLSTFEFDTHQSTKIYWIHCNLNEPDTLAELSKKLELPDDLIELCVENEPTPKLIDNSEMLTIDVQCLLSSEVKNQDIDFGNLVIHLTSKFCFTASYSEIPAISHFNKMYQRAVKYAKTPCFILFLILDSAINTYSEALLELDLLAEQIDLNIRETRMGLYSDVVLEEKKVMKIKRYTAAIQDILMRISGRRIPVISEQCRLSLANLFDHSQMIVREAEAVRDVLKGALAQIDNALMHNMNDTMRVLTAFAAIFLPLSLIASIYGMNFDWIPELHWKYGYFMALGLMVLCGFGLFYIFKKNKWF